MVRINNYKTKPFRKKMQTATDVLIVGLIITAIIVWYCIPRAQASEVPQGVEIMESTPWRSVPTLLNGSEHQNEVLAYAWVVSGYDWEYITMLRGENGTIDYQRVHDPSANTVGTDMGLCGVNSYFHPQIIEDVRFWTDWKWQVDRCYQLWAGGVTFYARNHNGLIM